jgi:hypothetical protein
MSPVPVFFMVAAVIIAGAALVKVVVLSVAAAWQSSVLQKLAAREASSLAACADSIRGTSCTMVSHVAAGTATNGSHEQL